MVLDVPDRPPEAGRIPEERIVIVPVLLPSRFGG